jgi:RNA polymerase sigma factor (sigma-70 family)
MKENIFDVFLIDDEKDFCQMLEMFLTSKGLSCKSFTDPVEALEAVVPKKIGCVITDYKMPFMNGDELTKKIKKIDSLLPVIFVTGKGSVSMAVKSIKAGGITIFEKPFSNEKLYSAVMECLSVNELERENRDRLADMLNNIEKLTPQEKNILKLLALGLSNKEIGLRLDISYRTVEVHRSHIMAKLQAKSLADLVRISDKI